MSGVTVVEMLDEALPAYDDALVRPAVSHLRSQDVRFHLSESALDWCDNGDDITVFTGTECRKMADYDGDYVLIAVDRTPVTDRFGLEAASPSKNERGHLETDEYGRAAVETIFAIGDVADEPILAHKASHEASSLPRPSLAKRRPPGRSTFRR